MLKILRLLIVKRVSLINFTQICQFLDTNMTRLSDKIIYVNEPLRYKGIVFYQTDWGIANLYFYNRQY